SGSGANKFSVAGARSYSNSFLLDGTDVNDSSNSTPGGSAGTNLGVDAIREFKIVATTFSAEYGRATGAVVSAVTRSGTNELHGTLFEFLDRKSTRLNSSHRTISYAVFCLKKKKNQKTPAYHERRNKYE